MSSCGDTTAAKDEVMPGKTKFDRSTQCIKCKTNRGNIVIRHTVYCKTCFDPLVVTKFRRCLDPTINPSASTARKKTLKASGDVMVGHSGGLGSTVLLDILARSYLSNSRTKTDPESSAKGGSEHPRREPIWNKAYVCHVDTFEATSEHDGDRFSSIRTLVREQYPGVECIDTKLENALDSEWWKMVNQANSDSSYAQLNLNCDGELRLNIVPNSTDPKASLRAYLAALPTPTAVQHAVATLVRLVLIHTARSLGCSHLLLGTSLTSLSISLIDSIAQGGGFNLTQETYEECPPTSGAEEHADSPLRVVRPLHDIGMKECAAWMYWHNLKFVGRSTPNILSSRQTIHGLTKAFIINLEKDYPSTVSTIVKTCAKVSARGETDGVCAICLRPTQTGARNWKAHISIRSRADEPRQPIEGIGVSQCSSDIFDRLCYSCHTTMTSRSSRSLQTQDSVMLPLPTWSGAVISYERRRKAMTRSEMEKVIDGYLLE